MSFTLHPQLQADTIRLAESAGSLLLLANDARYPWCILVPTDADVTEIYQLSHQQQTQLLAESSLLSEVMQTVFSADKMNVAALGNQVPQLHLHHIARFKTDPAWPKPIWGHSTAKPYSTSQLEERCALLANSELNTQFNFKSGI